MNGISELSNVVIENKPQPLIGDSGVNKNSWPDAVKLSVYLVN